MRDGRDRGCRAEFGIGGSALINMLGMLGNIAHQEPRHLMVDRDIPMMECYSGRSLYLTNLTVVCRPNLPHS